MIDQIIGFINTNLIGPGSSAAVLICGILLTFLLGRRMLANPRRLLSVLTGGRGDGMSPAKAMCVALSGTLGVGNISGVASAIALGGAGAVFWMLVSSLGALMIKYAETLLALSHRKMRDGRLHGGAFFVITDLGVRAAKPLAAFFAILTLAASLTLGSSVQSNAIALALPFGRLGRALCTLALSLLLLAVISGGLARISSITSALILPMSALYILMSLAVIIASPIEALAAIRSIVTEAFAPESVGGGFVGFITSRAFTLGVTRGIVSNEAGCGTAPIAHSSSSTSEPCVQGIWAMLEVFIDTCVISTMTALVVLIGRERGVTLSADGMRTAIDCFSLFIPIAPTLIGIAVVVFAFATMLCWYFYGKESLAYLCDSKVAHTCYRFVFVLSAALGGMIDGALLWNLSDLVISTMTVVNLTSVMLNLREIRRTSEYFFAKSRKMAKALAKPARM